MAAVAAPPAAIKWGPIGGIAVTTHRVHLFAVPAFVVGQTLIMNTILHNSGSGLKGARAFLR
jgi:hypothetical protein